VPSFHSGNQKWRVCVPARLTGTGKRKDVFFDDQRVAEKYIADLLADREEHGKHAITAEDRHWINVVRHELGDVAKLREVLDHWHRTGAGVTSITAGKAATEFLAWEMARKLDQETKYDISWRLHAFADHFGDRQLFQLTAGDVEKWLRCYTEGWARRSMWKRIKPLFAHAKRHRWLQVNPLDDLLPPETPSARREVYTPEQYVKLLTAAFEMESDALWLYLLLSGNAFLRVQELVRRHGDEPVLEWENLLWDRGKILVPEETAKSTKRKSGNERLIPLHQNIHDWLVTFRHGPVPTSGRVVDCSVGHFGELLKQLHAKAGVPFIKNGMRKSGISYYLARYPETGIGQLSIWAGNSESSCRQHYLKMLTEEEGIAWFAAPGKAFQQWFDKTQKPSLEQIIADTQRQEPALPPEPPEHWEAEPHGEDEELTRLD
jgi:hypothetical protein